MPNSECPLHENSKLQINLQAQMVEIWKICSSQDWPKIAQDFYLTV